MVTVTLGLPLNYVNRDQRVAGYLVGGGLPRICTRDRAAEAYGGTGIIDERLAAENRWEQ